MKFSRQQISLLMNSRILFVLSNCPYCLKYIRFIEQINLNLPFKKKIEVVDCLKYHDYKIVEDPRIPIFMQWTNGNYPCLFMDGQIYEGANSTEEALWLLKSYLDKDFILKEYNPDLFVDKCKWIDKRLICQEAE